MNKINSIITLRHFEKDEPLIIYSPEIADNVSLQMVNTIADISAYVYDDESFYDLDREITYGSNSYVINRKPSRQREVFVNAKDIVMVQEADIGLDDR